MRRFSIILLSMLVFAVPVSAQSWMEMFQGALRSLTGSSSEGRPQTETPRPLDREELRGVWSYQAPALKYTGDDILASLATSTLKGQLASYYQQAGLVPSAAKLTFVDRRHFQAQLEQKLLEGSYRYDSDSGQLTLEFMLGEYRASFTGSAMISDGVMTLLFEANAALAQLRASSPAAAQNERLKQIAALLQHYPGVMLGAELRK